MYYAIEQFGDYGKESYRHLISSWKGTPNLDADCILKEYGCMTRKVFGEDLYLTSLDTLISNVNRNEVTVKETIFYARRDGHLCDRRC